MIIVTGGAGFIGSNLIHAFNRRGERDILVVDNLTNGKKVHNLADLEIADYMDKLEFIEAIKSPSFLNNVSACFHQGACSSTTEWDGRYVMQNNYDFSKRLLHACIEQSIPFIYASSASVYGSGKNGFSVDRRCELPINMYAYSKLQFDQYVRRITDTIKSQIVGLRYFNVYGPREQHKDSMSSTAFHFNRQILSQGHANLFAGTDGIADGEQRRDFVFVDDVVKVNLWFFDHPDRNGLFNTGTGQAETFNTVANAVIDWHQKGEIKYIPFPEHLKGAYQNYTQADLSNLRQIGYLDEFIAVKQGVMAYLDWLNQSRS
ncbi:MAG: ADP-glyceromanno-heptose 6-epimerase [Methylobacter sp.]|nr:MAG: ADP-glyceromanno-heptose 6-epimerase [Methylobacter sp.]PPD17322.1 MAG: ADP-glyceromanno-heptose 6-epimerase [Methylobacter sp.]PPD36150.1 MAG: ADP-glyceromanno-heptose 6-epimerase [Methylomonas sp.]